MPQSEFPPEWVEAVARALAPTLCGGAEYALTNQDRRRAFAVGR